MSDTIKICVGNYSSYAAGYLIDEWIDLPVTPRELQDFLDGLQTHAQSLTSELSEEFYVSDYDGIPLPNCPDLFGENTSIDSLNLLAMQLDMMSSGEIESVDAYLSNQGSRLTIDEALNACLQTDDIPFYGYGWGTYQGSDPAYAAIHDSASNEKKFAYCVFEELYPDVWETLGNTSVMGIPICDFLDMEEVGAALERNSNVVLFDDGYLDCEQDGPDLNYYSHEELEEEIIGQYFSEEKLAADIPNPALENNVSLSQPEQAR